MHIAEAGCRQAVMSTHELQSAIDELHGRFSETTSGEVATYIPELGKANPEDFGISLVTTGGDMFQAGDCDRGFTIQSISKPFTFGMALEALGAERVARHVGVEPSGDAFNAIELQNGSNRPFNPMVNSGAITVTALLHAKYGADTFDHILDRFSRAAGRPLAVDWAVYESERRTGHRNRAIAHLLLNFGLVHEEAEAALDIYFRQCSILVTTRDLATMGATLANIGRNPITGEHAFDLVSVKSMMAIMFTCGMYDYSGEWAFRVGVPAKSGVSGGVLAVVNRQLGIATYSPRLDARGNSHRGIEVCAELASRFGLHTFDCLNMGSSFLDHLLSTES
jgi:glutaminase